MNDAATLAGKPRPLVVDGRTYMVYPLTLGDFGEMQSWVDAQFPDPIAIATKAIEKGDFNVAQQQYLLKIAMEQSCKGRRLIGTPEADEKLYTPAGMKEILFRTISKGDPSFTREAAADLHSRMNMAHVHLLQSASNIDMVTTDPKGEATDGGPV